MRATQTEVGHAAGVSQGWISRMERGGGRTASLETWASVAAANGLQLVAFLERRPGAPRPRDYEHLKRQTLVIDTAARGAWDGDPEVAIDPDWIRSRSVDVLLRRPTRNELAVVEIWDAFDDVGGAWRGLDAKVAAIARAHPASTVGGLVVVRATRRNRELIREFGTAFRARHPASPAAWLRALTSSEPMPLERGFLWTDVAGTRLFAARL